MRQPNWSQFNPETYLKDNYIRLHEEDKKIIARLAKFYQKVPRLKLIGEIGVGPNLYPIMAALPFTNRIEAVDYSLRNIAYLQKQKKCIDPFWIQYLDLFQKECRLYEIDLVKELRNKLVIKRGNIYRLPKERYDLCSMHFCAESITDRKREFIKACRRYIVSVKQKGFLIASFMENSNDYSVGKYIFPSYPVNRHILQCIFHPYTTNLTINRIEKARQALRPGYTGMLLLTAQRK